MVKKWAHDVQLKRGEGYAGGEVVPPAPQTEGIEAVPEKKYGKFGGQPRRAPSSRYTEPTAAPPPTEPTPEPPPPTETDPVDAHSYILKYAGPTEAEQLRRATDFQYDPSKHGVTTESYQARKKAEAVYHKEVRLTHQSLTDPEKATFEKQFIDKDTGKITDTRGALDYLLLYSEPSNIASLQSSITGLEETPLILGATTRTALEKEQQKALEDAFGSLTDPEKAIYMTRYGVFGEDGKTFAELQEAEPAISGLTYKEGKPQFEYDYGAAVRKSMEGVSPVEAAGRGIFDVITQSPRLFTVGGSYLWNLATGQKQKGFGEQLWQDVAKGSYGVHQSMGDYYDQRTMDAWLPLASKTIGLESPFITSYALPAITGGAFGAVTPTLGAVGASMVARGGIAAVTAKVAPYAVIGAVSVPLGVHFGTTAAYEAHDIYPLGTTAGQVTGMIPKFAFMYAGYQVGSAWARGPHPTLGGMKVAGKDYFGSRFPVKQIKTEIDSFTRYSFHTKQMRSMVKDYPFHKLEGTHTPISYGLKNLGMRIKSSVFEPTTLQYRQMYGMNKPYLFSEQPYMSREIITTRGQLPGYRDISFLKESMRVPTTYEMHEAQIAFQKQLRFKLDLMKNIKVITKTQVRIDPKFPTEAFFKTTRVGKDIFSIGEVKQMGQVGGETLFKPSSAKGIKEILTLDGTTPQGQITSISGRTYYKLSPENIFYQERPFAGFVSSKYFKDVGGYVATKTYGFYNEISSRGFTLQKDYFAGESFIQQGSMGGHLQQIKHDFSIALSKGAFRSRLMGEGGVYEDIMATFKPKLPGSGEYYGESGGFDLRTLTKGTVGDLVMPGGSGVQQTIKPLPSIFESAYQRPLTLFQLESLESGIVSSAYWGGTTPQASFLALAPITTLAQAQISKTALASKTALGQVQIQTPLSIQLQQPSQLQSQSLAQSQAQLQKQVQLQSQSLTQSQVQMQTQVQLQKQLQLTKQSQVQLQKQTLAQMQVSMLLSPTLLVSTTIGMGMPGTPSIQPPPYTPPPPVYPFLVLPPGKHEPTVVTKGQAFNTLIRERRFFKGKELKEGKFIKINKVPLTEFGALSLGATVADNSASKTFKIEKTSGKPKQPTMDIDSWNFLQGKFIKKGDKFIEQPFAAIDTPGEVAGISARGWIVERRKATRITKPRKVRIKREELIGFEMPDMFADFDKLFGRFDFGF